MMNLRRLKDGVGYIGPGRVSIPWNPTALFTRASTTIRPGDNEPDTGYDAIIRFDKTVAMQDCSPSGYSPLSPQLGQAENGYGYQVD